MTIRTQGVEVTLDEIFNFGIGWDEDGMDGADPFTEYEYFVDLLRDKLNLPEGEYDRCMVHEFSLMGVPRPNVAHFDVTYIIEDSSGGSGLPEADLPADQTELTCVQCGADVWIDQNGTAFHWGGGLTGIDHDLDADHTAVPDIDHANKELHHGPEPTGR